MRIVDIRECAIPLKSDMRNSSFDFSEMTTSVVALLTDVVREGKRVIGFAFNSTGRYACGAAMRARFIPRILGVWLMLNCFAYLATSITGILGPHYEQRVSNWVFPLMFGELAIMLWLILVGAKERQPLASAA